MRPSKDPQKIPFTTAEMQTSNTSSLSFDQAPNKFDFVERGQPLFVKAHRTARKRAVLVRRPRVPLSLTASSCLSFTSREFADPFLLANPRNRVDI